MADGVYFISNEDEPDHGQRNTFMENPQEKFAFNTVYWPVILVVYFLWSFSTGSWAYSWVIFILGGFFKISFASSEK